jgi:hypothetical protein
VPGGGAPGLARVEADVASAAGGAEIGEQREGRDALAAQTVDLLGYARVVDGDDGQRVDPTAERAHAQDDGRGVELVHELDKRPALWSGKAQHRRLDLGRELLVEGTRSALQEEAHPAGLRVLLDAVAKQRSSEVAW